MFLSVRKNIVYPDSITTLAGSSIEIYCLTFTDVIWKFNRGALPSNALTTTKESDSVLIIKNVAGTNSGLYSCWTEEARDIIYEGICILKVKGKFIKYFVLWRR